MKSLDTSPTLSLSDIVFITNKNRYEKLYKKDILFIEAQGAYVDIYVKDGVRNLSTHLKSFLFQLSDASFVQVSRSHAVNILHIDGFSKDELKIKHHSISISRPFRQDLLKLLPIIKTKIPMKEDIYEE